VSFTEKSAVAILLVLFYDSSTSTPLKNKLVHPAIKNPSEALR